MKKIGLLIILFVTILPILMCLVVAGTASADVLPAYRMPDSWFQLDGVSYNQYYEYDYPPNAQFFSRYYGEDSLYASSDEPPTFIPLDGENNVDVGLYQLWSGWNFTSYNMTVYYRHGDKEDFEAYIIDDEGATIINSSTYESIFTANGYGEEYTYAGNPDGWTIGGGSDPAVMPLFVNPFDFGESSYFMEMPRSFYPFAMPSAIIFRGYDGENPTCEDFYASQHWVAPIIPYILVRQSVTETEVVGYGGLMGFNTSSIPDDAVVTSVILHLCPFYWESDNESPQIFVVGGTYNNSFLPIEGGYEVAPEDFYGDFAEFTTSDIPICMGESEECANWNQSVYMNIPLSADGLMAVNKSGLTVLSVRLLDSINEVCPIGNTLVDSVFFTTYEVPEGPRGWYPQSWVTVNWEEPSPLPHMNSTVTVMAEIVGILFAIFGILLLVFVLFKVEGLGLVGKTGVVFGISILLILGAIITMAMINAFK